MIALVLGDENRANPKPITIRLSMTNPRPVFWPRKVNRKSAIMVKPIPMDATTLGSILSESLPARGETKAITTGWQTKIVPACWGESPLVYCK